MVWNANHNDVKTIGGKRIATPEYQSWQTMKNRCQNPKAKDYHYYGGRGIKVCSRWQEFHLFLEDMGRKPTKAHTLERVDGAKNYTPNNCCWATRKTQAQNRTYCQLNQKKADEIRQRYAAGEKQVPLASDYGVTQTTISQVIRGKTWK